MRPTPGFRMTSRALFWPCRSATRAAAMRFSSMAATRPEPISTASERHLIGSLAHHAEIAYAQVESETLQRRVAMLEAELAKALEPR